MKKPVVLIVMDGVGLKDSDFGNAVNAAYKPALDMLINNHPNTVLKAHGTAVGLPSDDDMGNSEVGHNALGCGQIYSQGAKLVNNSIETGAMFESNTWNMLTQNCINNESTLHFLGLLSDGNVHSNIEHLKAMMIKSKEFGVKRVRLHILLDGRDVPATSAFKYVDDIENLIAELNDASFDIKIASGGGRMKITMDRYEADWNMVKKGWDTHVLGEGRFFATAREAIEIFREESGVLDQDLPPFIIAENKEPVGRILDNDSVILFNFRGDRAIEISRAFDESMFDKFNRVFYPKVVFAGMLQYDGDLQIPKNYLVSPPAIKDTLSELLVKNKLSQYAVSETQKFGHVTYFWNGNRSEKFSEELEEYYEEPSDKVSFDERPWMKAAEVTDKIVEAIKSRKYMFIRANYPNGDMVGHTGNFQAAKLAVEAVDLCLARVLKTAEEYGVTVLITADHGNADEMYEPTKDMANIKPKTAHTLNPVPFIIFDKDTKHTIKPGNFGLANVAPTIADLFGIEKPEMWEESIIDI